MKGEKKRSENEREKTKMRERKRRAITTNIFQGLRKHGGYYLSHRSDINAVLRQLANEAGFVVEPDGTTYRSKALIKCPLCGAATANLSSIPNSTITTNGSTSTTSLPLPRGVISSSIGDPAAAVTVAVPNNDHGTNNNLGVVAECSSPLLCFDGPISVPVYTCQDHVAVETGGGNGGDGFEECCAAMAMGSNGNGNGMTYEEMQQEALRLEEGANMSNRIHSSMVGPMPMSLPHF